MGFLLTFVHQRKCTMKKHATLYLFLLMATGGTLCFLFFHLTYAYHLFHREQMLLFTYTAEQLAGYWKQPAVLACLGGDFLTQFFHYPTIGAGCLTAVLLGVGIAVYQSCCRWTGRLAAAGIATLVFVWEGLRCCDIHYPLAGSLALVGGCGCFLLADRLKGKWLTIAGSLLGGLLGYWWFGYGAGVFALFTLLAAVARRSNYLAAALAWMVAVWAPFVTAGTYLMLPAQAYTYPATTWWGMPNRENERILGLSTEDYASNHSQVEKLVRNGKPANSVAVCYNLANAIHGQLAERLLDYDQPAALGLFLPINETSTYLSTQLAGEVWFQLGDMTMAEHAAILSMIFSPQSKNVRMVKRLAEINLINKDKEAARKYLRMLMHTLAYRQWAIDRLPGKETEEVKKWLAEKRSLLPATDTLRMSATDVAKSLHLLLQANPNNRMACEYLLCLDLLMKDLPTFAKDYDTYHSGSPNRLYAEALLIHLYRQRATGEEVKARGIAPEIVKAFNAYNNQHARSQGNPNALRSGFGKTYWFYYQFANFQ